MTSVGHIGALFHTLLTFCLMERIFIDRASCFFLFSGNGTLFHLPRCLFFPVFGQWNALSFTARAPFSCFQAMECSFIYRASYFFLFLGNGTLFHLPRWLLFPVFGQWSALSFTARAAFSCFRAMERSFIYRAGCFFLFSGNGTLFHLPHGLPFPVFGQWNALSFTSRAAFFCFRAMERSFIYRAGCFFLFSGNGALFHLPRGLLFPVFGLMNRS
jgi:hypothetical protein